MTGNPNVPNKGDESAINKGLGGISDAIGDVSSGVHSAIQNIWVSRADDKLAAKDVYKAPDKNVTNDSPKKETSIFDEISDALTLKDFRANNADAIKGISDEFAAAKSKIGDITSKLTSIKNDVTKVIKTVSSAMAQAQKTYAAIQQVKKAFNSKGDIFSKIAGTDRALGNALKATGIDIDPGILRGLNEIATTSMQVGGVVKAVKSTDFTKLQSVGKLIGATTGISDIVTIIDYGTKLATAVSITNSSISAGVPNAVGAIHVSVPADMIGKYAQGVLSTVTCNGDIVSLTALDAVSGAGALNRIHPEIIKEFSRAFSYSGSSIGVPKADRFNQLMAAYNSIDPNWAVGSIGDIKTVDISKLTYSSSDFRDLVAYGVLNKLAAGAGVNSLIKCCSIFRPTSVLYELRKNFPNTVINENIVVRSAKRMAA